MNVKGMIILAGCALSFNCIAGTMGSVVFQSAPLPWIAVGSLGYNAYQNIVDCDSQTALGRFAIAKELFGTPYSNLGLELGVQSGNTMQLDVPEATLNELGGLPIQTTMKPMLDLLVTVKITPTQRPFFALLKGGLAYRHWQFNGRNSINNLSRIAGEIQAGIGYPIGSLASLSLLYQGIYGGNPNFIVSESCPTGRVSRLPTQQGVLLSFSFNFFS